MKKVCWIIGWTIGSVIILYLAGQLLLLVVFHLLGITMPHGKLINGVPPAVALVLRWLGTLIQLVVVTVILVLGIKGRLPGTRSPSASRPPDPARST